MPDFVGEPEPEPETPAREAYAAKLADLRDRADEAARVALTGDTGAPIRRSILFVLVGIGLFAGGIFAAVGIVALLALALTDAVVEL